MTPSPEWLFQFDLTPAEARQLQARLPALVIRRDKFRKIETVAGADIALEEHTGYAAVIVYSFPALQELERVAAVGALRFPYVPGLLAFREVPLLLEAFARLKRKPDLILADGHGWAHPRRAGMACHLGLALDLPTIGCAKSLLVGSFSPPGESRGARAALRDGRERIGTVLRTRDGVRPVFVSCGHRVSLSTAVRLVMQCCDGYRIPKPQREADRWVRRLKRHGVNPAPAPGP
ncbi:MAG TPA: deoxyribonuclease V [Terriglobia bacterium]|nr:deoxyribonuclease V [Terriglobia bacterium]